MLGWKRRDHQLFETVSPSPEAVMYVVPRVSVTGVPAAAVDTKTLNCNVMEEPAARLIVGTCETTLRLGEPVCVETADAGTVITVEMLDRGLCPLFVSVIVRLLIPPGTREV